MRTRRWSLLASAYVALVAGCSAEEGTAPEGDMAASQKQEASDPSSNDDANTSTAGANDRVVGQEQGSAILLVPRDEHAAESPEETKTTVTFDDFQEFPSTQVIYHSLDRSMVGSVMTGESLQLTFLTKDADGREISFWFDYSEGDVTFPIGENGNLGFDKDGVHWDARGGEVTIEVGDGTMRLTFTDIEMAPFLPDTTHGEPVPWGNGSIVGVVHRSCYDAQVDLGNQDGVERQPTPIESKLDEAWAEEFCEGAL